MCRRWCGTPAPSRTRRPALSTSAPCGRPPQLDASAPSPTPAASGPTTTLSRSQRHETHRPRRKTPAGRGGAQARTPERSDRPGIHHPASHGGIPMIDEITEYTMLGRRGEHYEVPDAIQAAPGLVVFRLPHGLALNNPCRWQIGHHSGGCIAESTRRENALKGAALMASLYDWTQQPAALEAEVDHRAL